MQNKKNILAGGSTVDYSAKVMNDSAFGMKNSNVRRNLQIRHIQTIVSLLTVHSKKSNILKYFSKNRSFFFFFFY